MLYFPFPSRVLRRAAARRAAVEPEQERRPARLREIFVGIFVGGPLLGAPSL